MVSPAGLAQPVPTLAPRTTCRHVTMIRVLVFIITTRVPIKGSASWPLCSWRRSVHFQHVWLRVGVQ